LAAQKLQAETAQREASDAETERLDKKKALEDAKKIYESAKKVRMMFDTNIMENEEKIQNFTDQLNSAGIDATSTENINKQIGKLELLVDQMKVQLNDNKNLEKIAWDNVKLAEQGKKIADDNGALREASAKAAEDLRLKWQKQNEEAAKQYKIEKDASQARKEANETRKKEVDRLEE